MATFTLGSSLDHDEEWSVVSEKESSKKESKILTPKQHALYFAKEKRRGKVVTLVGPFSLQKEDAKALLKSLKKSLGAGGSIKEEFMEFQGECSEKLKVLLTQKEFHFKK